MLAGTSIGPMIAAQSISGAGGIHAGTFVDSVTATNGSFATTMTAGTSIGPVKAGTAVDGSISAGTTLALVEANTAFGSAQTSNVALHAHGGPIRINTHLGKYNGTIDLERDPAFEYADGALLAEITELGSEVHTWTLEQVAGAPGMLTEVGLSIDWATQLWTADIEFAALFDVVKQPPGGGMGGGM